MSDTCIKPDMITCKPTCLRLEWLIHRSALSVKSVPMTGEHLSDFPALLHVLSQDNCGVLLSDRATSALYWTARRLMSERTLAGVILKKTLTTQTNQKGSRKLLRITVPGYIIVYQSPQLASDYSIPVEKPLS
ncbi:hypothetical protein TNCV_1835091 [Trichonephila clavipes]|nr:hypothetical protein TNCV_1835091 [Trichonephila clavipes]